MATQNEAQELGGSLAPDTTDTSMKDADRIRVERDHELPHPEISDLLVVSELKKEVPVPIA